MPQTLSFCLLCFLSQPISWRLLISKCTVIVFYSLLQSQMSLLSSTLAKINHISQNDNLRSCNEIDFVNLCHKGPLGNRDAQLPIHKTAKILGFISLPCKTEKYVFDPSSKVHQNFFIFNKIVSNLYLRVKDLFFLVEQVQACVSDCRFFKSLSQSRNKDDVAQVGCPRDTVSCAATMRIYRKNIARHLRIIQFSTESNLI